MPHGNNTVLLALGTVCLLEVGLQVRRDAAFVKHTHPGHHHKKNSVAFRLYSQTLHTTDELRQSRMSTMTLYVMCCVQLLHVLQQWHKLLWQASKDARGTKQSGIVAGIAGLIGNTPLVRIRSLSELTGCEVYPLQCSDCTSCEEIVCLMEARLSSCYSTLTTHRVALLRV